MYLFTLITTTLTDVTDLKTDQTNAKQNKTTNDPAILSSEASLMIKIEDESHLKADGENYLANKAEESIKSQTGTPDNRYLSDKSERAISNDSNGTHHYGTENQANSHNRRHGKRADARIKLPGVVIELGYKRGEQKNGEAMVRTQSSSHDRQQENREGNSGADVETAAEYGLKALKELIDVKEPLLYQLGLYLSKDDPARKVAYFGAPKNEKAIKFSRFGYAALETTKKIAELYPRNVGRNSAGLQDSFKSRKLQEECPLRGRPRCSQATRRYRTPDGTCNNFQYPWRGSAVLPMARFLSPVYEDGIQEIRKSISGKDLPSARDISVRIHRDKNIELPTLTLMFTQWGQFIDHDLISTVKSSSFNGSIPRCCQPGGRGSLPLELLHPSCAPISVSDDDWFLSSFGIRCLEFIRSAPSTRIDCDLGWREQINQVTTYLDASTIYGSDIETSDFIRTFRKGKLQYGRPINQGPLQPPDPPEGELCRQGALAPDCFEGGDGRFTVQPGLIAMHTIWLRYHNRIATVISKINTHWSDEKVFQETRRIVGALIQHITYREFLPIVLGQEVMELFELKLQSKGYYKGYNAEFNPAIANSFGAAAFRFGHSMIQNSYIRTDIKHRPIFNNVTLHDEPENVENIWSLGSLDRLILGFCNQASQRRDEFICDELTNHLFQSPGFPFGMDIAAINIQRGRDHGIPPYTSWREPCGLFPIKNWVDLQKVLSIPTVQRFKALYDHVDDIDLFTGGLAEKPVRGGIVGPTFACIIAQQFLNLRKGDRFWYEIGGFESSFTPAQLQEIRHVTLASVLCNTLTEIETIQPFVFLSSDKFRNARLNCKDPLINNFDLTPWSEKESETRRSFKNKSELKDELNLILDEKLLSSERQCDTSCARKKKKKRPPVRKPVKVPVRSSTPRPRPTTRPPVTKQPPLRIKVTNVTTSTVYFDHKYNGYDSYDGNMPSRPSFNFYNSPQMSRPVVRPNFDDKRVTYMVGTFDGTKTTPSTINHEQPLEVNIRIKYFMPSSHSSTTERVINIRPNPNFQTKRPEHFFPVYIEEFGISSTGKPLYNIKKRPEIGYASNVRPSDDLYEYLKPYESIKTTTKKTYIVRPPSYYENYHNFRPQQEEYDFPYYNHESSSNQNTQQISSPLLIVGGSGSKRPSYISIDDKLDKPVNPYSYYHQPNEQNRDHLDFKTKFILHKRGSYHEQLNDKRYVKISSVKADAIIDHPGKETDIHVSQREGNLDLYDLEQASEEKDKVKEVKVVDIDILPSEMREDQWLVYNETEENSPEIPMPVIDFNIPTSNELPRPIKLVNDVKFYSPYDTNKTTRQANLFMKKLTP